MLTHNLGYPRIGSHRELKQALEQYWLGTLSLETLLQEGKTLRRDQWLLQKEAGIDLIPCNDFSFYDQVLDMSLTVGAIPKRYEPLQTDPKLTELDLYFAMARGYQRDGFDVIARAFPNLKIILTTYFEGLRDNAELAVHLSVHALHLDLVRAPQQLDAVLAIVPERLHISLGIVDGRNVWKNDFQASLARISQAVERLGSERVLLAPSCSLLHVPCDLGLETNETALPAEVKRWLAFARQKLDEVVTLARLADTATREPFAKALMDNIADIASRKQSGLIHTPKVKERVVAIAQQDTRRSSPFPLRRKVQRE